MLDFFRALWQVPSEGFVTFWLSDRAGNSESLHVPLDDILNDPDPESSLRDLQQRGNGKNVYFGLGLRDPDVSLSKTQRGKKGQVVALPAFAVDLDIADGRAHKSADLPRTEDDAIAILSCAPPPTIVVHSGFGIQAYWAFASPLEWAPNKHGRVEKLTEEFQNRFHHRAAELGFKIDPGMHDVTRVWRLPGFLNVKDPSNLRRAEILGLDASKRYRLEQLVATGSYPAAQTAVAVGPAGLVSPPPRAEGTSQAGGASASPGDLNEVVKYLRVLSEPDRRAIWENILAGRPFAQEGGRDITLRNATASLLGLKAARACTDTQLASLFEASIAAMSVNPNPANEPPTMDAVRKKIFSARSFVEKQDAEQQASLQTLNRIMRERMFGSVPKFAEDGEPILEDEPEYDAIDPVRHSIIQFRANYYLYNYQFNRFSPVKIKDEILSYARDAWEGSRCDIAYADKDGNIKDKTIPMIMKAYGTNVDNVVYHMGIDRSKYDPSTRTFLEAVAHLRVTEPQYNQDIDTWLRLLFAGEHLDKALDWVATVTHLTRQTCALYLSGPAGAGKTLLAQGLARLWTSEWGPTEYSRVIGNFNEDLLHCPLVFADEFIPKTKDHPLAQIREMTGTSIRTISRKNISNAKLMGAVRIILAANNDQLLASAHDSMSQDDLEATCKRILHIPVSVEAAVFLAKLTPLVTQSWILGDLIAKHVLWLRDNRTVNMTGRFLVEGPVTSANRRLVGSGGIADLLREWMIRYASNPSHVVNAWQAQKGSPIKARIGHGHVLINVDAVTEFWGDYVLPRETPCPTSGRIAKMLKNHASGEYVQSRLPSGSRGIRYHKIEGDFLKKEAEQLHIGDPDAIELHLSRPYEENEQPKKKILSIVKEEKPVPPKSNGQPDTNTKPIA